MTRHWRLEERVKGLLDPNRRITTTMNTQHLVLMAITLAGGTTVIAGARIVASPNPRVPQDSVELFAHYNPKTHSVAITQKSHKKAAQVVSRKANAASKTFKTVRIEPMSFTVASSAVHEGKSTTAKIARISEPVVVQYVTADGKASKVADPAKAVVTYSTASGEPVVVRDVNSDSTAVTITSVAAGEVKRPAIVYQVKPVESHGTITYTTTTSSQDKVGKVLIAHSSTVSEVKPDQVVLARPVPEGDSKHVFVQLKDSEPKTGLVFVKAKGGAERGIEVFANPNMVDSTGKTVFVQAKDVDPTSKSSGSKDHIAYTITADPLSQIATASEIRLNTNYKPMVVKDGRLSYTIENQKSNKPTIVTIQGGDIKIEGENIKVVYVKPTTKPPHQPAQKSQIKVKSKGK